ncbi:MAG: exopolysaccharide Pel transporter PelG [Clostridia bacterium]
MAGIGFELKKLFAGKGLFKKARAYVYAGIICSGTMLLAIALMLSVTTIAKENGATARENDLLIVLMTYTLIGSLLICSPIQMLLTRCVADLLFMKSYDRVLPSLYGSVTLLMAIGGPAFALLLWFAPGVFWVDRLLSWCFFMELAILWIQMAYITALKDYQRVFFGFLLGVITAIGCSFLLLALGLPVLTAMLSAVFLGYGVMVVCFAYTLSRYFPPGRGSLFYFCKWFGKYPSLLLIGLFSSFGAFVHLVLMWYSPISVVVDGVLRAAPAHDVAAFFAFMVSLPTVINFVVSVEVNFYDKYRKYFSAVIEDGTLGEIDQARGEMVTVLKQEVLQLAQVQVFVLIAFIVLGKYFLEPIGFSREMLDMFRLMCVGYSAYGVGNSVMQLQLYFDDRMGALMTTFVFFTVNGVVTLLLINGPLLLYGVGLLVGGVLMYIVAIARLLYYVKDVDYYVYCGQPVLAIVRDTVWDRLVRKLDERALSTEESMRANTKGESIT